jgi:hypothetical protein
VGGRSNGDHDFRVDAVDQSGGRIAVALSWADRQGTRHELGQVLTVEDGGIADLQDHRSGAAARRAL